MTLRIMPLTPLPIRHQLLSSSLLLALCFSLWSPPTAAQEIDHWESMVTLGDTCRYLVPTGEVDTSWKEVGFDDSSWNRGPGGVGYGDGDDPTIIPQTISVYCRYRIEIPDPLVVSDLLLDMDFDDGFVAYLNGTEIARSHMGQAGEQTSWSAPATELHEATLYQGILPPRFPLGDLLPELLDSGTNILAVEVHNQAITSSDLSSNTYLHASLTTGERHYSDPPAWFMPPFRSDSTLLPLMVIDTDGVGIPDEPKISARMGLVFNGNNRYNSERDSFNVYDGKIAIELRGESSLYFYPKVSYGLETQTDSGTNNNVSLLGMPAENDYVLHGPYADKSLMRNVISYGLYERMGRYAPRTRFLELVLNGEYLGVYVLTEKLKRDRNRVDMAKLNPWDTSQVEITGGYLLRVDKLTRLESGEFWESSVDPPYEGFNRVVYQFYDPKHDEMVPRQKDYIRKYLEKFEQVLVSPWFMDPDSGYRAYLDIPSFIDLMILNEFTKDVDAFRLSHYFYKQKITNGGKLVQGPPWDYNLTFGNNDFAGDVNATHSWIYDIPVSVYWWARLMEDPWFRNELYCRWDDLHRNVLSRNSVYAMIDSSQQVLGDAVSRNFMKWPVLGKYVWPNSFFADTYEGEIAYLREWSRDRLLWMEGKWGGLCQQVSRGPDPILRPRTKVRVYPNPSDHSGSFLFLSFPPGEEITLTIHDMNGRLVLREGNIQAAADGSGVALPDRSHLPPGIYTLVYRDAGRRRAWCKLVRQ